MNPDIIVYVRADRFGAADADVGASDRQRCKARKFPAIANQKVIEMDYDDVMDYGHGSSILLGDPVQLQK